MSRRIEGLYPAAAVAPHALRRTGLRGDTFDAAILWAFVAGLAWTPFWFASNDLLAWGINAIFFPGLALVFETSVLIRRRPHPVAISRIALPALLFSTVVVWIALQSATWTPGARHHPIWGLAADALGGPLEGSISVNRDLTVQALVRLLTSASVLWLALQLGRDADRANRIAAAIAAICVAYAGYGLIAFAATPGYVLWFENRFIDGYVASTFFNRNNFATYAGIGFIVLAGLLLKLYRHQISGTEPARLRLAAFIETTGGAGAMHFVALFVVLAALLLSGSRGGIASALFGGFVLAALTFGRDRKRALDQRRVILVVALVVAATFVGFGDTLLGKIGRLGFSDDTRMAVYTIALRSIADAPLLGYGYGTFADVFPMFRDRSVDPAGVWLMAHNTYLELFQGLGVVFGAMLIASVGLLVVRCFRGAVARKMNATLPSVAAGVACLLAVNSLVDFSLQIQAVALTFMAILGVGVAQAESSRLSLHD